jgi:aspartate 1-decarboxylase
MNMKKVETMTKPKALNSECGRILVHLLKSKIHRAYVTAASLDYEGSLTIDREFMEKVGLFPYEKILCSNLANGARFETYAIPGDPASGQIILNGAAAHLGKPGDRITIMSFTEIDSFEADGWHPRVIVLGENNLILNERGI